MQPHQLYERAVTLADGWGEDVSELARWFRELEQWVDDGGPGHRNVADDLTVSAMAVHLFNQNRGFVFFPVDPLFALASKWESDESLTTADYVAFRRLVDLATVSAYAATANAEKAAATGKLHDGKPPSRDELVLVAGVMMQQPDATPNAHCVAIGQAARIARMKIGRHKRLAAIKTVKAIAEVVRNPPV